MNHANNITNTSIKSNHDSVSRDFLGVWVPREIWLHPDLSLHAKCLWSEIRSLNNRECGGCFASNEYLADFLGVKISRLKEVLKELRDTNLLEDVSYNGRVRIIRALNPPIDYGGHQTAGKPAIRQPEKCIPPTPPTDYIDKSLDNNTSLKVSPKVVADKSANAAKAAEKKPKKSSADFSEEVKELGDAMMDAIVQAKPDFAVPQTRTPLYTHVDLLLRVDKRSAARILAVLRWALADHFWHRHMQKANVAKYLRENNRFDQLEASMTTKAPKKERKFAPSSDDAKALESIKAMKEGAL